MSWRDEIENAQMTMRAARLTDELGNYVLEFVRAEQGLTARSVQKINRFYFKVLKTTARGVSIGDEIVHAIFYNRYPKYAVEDTWKIIRSLHPDQELIASINIGDSEMIAGQFELFLQRDPATNSTLPKMSNKGLMVGCTVYEAPDKVDTDKKHHHVRFFSLKK